MTKNSLGYFIECYEPQYGDETKELVFAMQNENEKLALLNSFLPNTFAAKKFFDFDQLRFFQEAPKKNYQELLSHYFLDASSVWPPLLLPLKKGDRVLDMCSAPGGKLLTLISRRIPQINYVANDISSARLNRLRKVLEQFLPKEFLQTHIRLSQKDGNFFGLKLANQFDAVLLDAPCSSEAHVINNQSLLKKFKSISKSLPKRQYSLICSALLALKPGGFLMYSTCSINQLENQKLIEKVVKKKSDLCQIVPIDCPIGQKEFFGHSILPHKHGAGPAYFCLLRKK